MVSSHIQLAEIQQDLQKNILFVNKRGVWGLGYKFKKQTNKHKEVNNVWLGELQVSDRSMKMSIKSNIIQEL